MHGSPWIAVLAKESLQFSRNWENKERNGEKDAGRRTRAIALTRPNGRPWHLQGEQITERVLAFAFDASSIREMLSHAAKVPKQARKYATKVHLVRVA